MWGFLRSSGLVIRHQEFSPAHITITVQRAKADAPCPSCGRVSRSRHSSYTRLLMDLPADGRTVNIQLVVRRFRCKNPSCRRRVFAERFPRLVRTHARRTERLESLLTRIGVFLGGEAGARLSQDLRVPVSPDTMLRLLYRMELAPAVGLRVVGIDEWAWRKGVRYGTIVCDLESGRPVELLPEAQAETVARWLAGHPGIEVVSRDRAGMFADAAALGAPQAVQVADRWHLLRNLGDVAERVLVGLSIPPIRVEKTEPLAKRPRTTELKDRETRKDAERRQRQQRRQALYDEIHDLYEKTKSIRAVADRLGIDRRTVRKYLNAPECPQPKPRGGRPSILDPYRDYILARWAEGCRNAAQLYREIVERGYPGSRTIVKDFVATLRRGTPAERIVRRVRLGPRRLRRWFTCPPEKLDENERRFLDMVLEASPSAREAYSLLQEFRRILTERRADALRAWLDQAARSSLAPLRGFARSLEQDMDAVMNALTYPWSNGRVEGCINKLKLLKRQMYGRAGIELLRRRFLAMGR